MVKGSEQGGAQAVAAEEGKGQADYRKNCKYSEGQEGGTGGR